MGTPKTPQLNGMGSHETMRFVEIYSGGLPGAILEEALVPASGPEGVFISTEAHLRSVRALLTAVSFEIAAAALMVFVYGALYR